jgi:hypothetical protein
MASFRADSPSITRPSMGIFSGAGHGRGLEQLGEGEQRGDGRRLDRLADKERPDDRHRHQEVHVEAQAPERPDALGEEVPAADQRSA